VCDACDEKKHVQQNDESTHRRDFDASEYEINNDVPILSFKKVKKLKTICNFC